jgi:small-conductance mechanosensitive channel
MPATDLAITAASWLDRHDHQVTAGITLAAALGLAFIVDRAFARRGQVLTRAIGAGELTPVARTRLRFLRRFAGAGIVAIGLIAALAQFGTFHRAATSLIASGALAAAIIGFAARQVLANAVAGVMLAITQPLRIGDRVNFEDQSGTVEDVRLNYTYLRTGDGRRVVIPNERLAGGILRNESIPSPHVAVEASVWLPPGADADRALAALADEARDGEPRIEELAPDGIRVVVPGGETSAEERPRREAELRAACLRRLREAGTWREAPPAEGDAEPASATHGRGH